MTFVLGQGPPNLFPRRSLKLIAPGDGWARAAVLCANQPVWMSIGELLTRFLSVLSPGNIPMFCFRTNITHVNDAQTIDAPVSVDIRGSPQVSRAVEFADRCGIHAVVS